MASRGSRGSRGSRVTSSRHLSSRQFTRTISRTASRHSSSVAPILHRQCLLVSPSTSFYCAPLRTRHPCHCLSFVCQLADTNLAVGTQCEPSVVEHIERRLHEDRRLGTDSQLNHQGGKAKMSRPSRMSRTWKTPGTMTSPRGCPSCPSPW